MTMISTANFVVIEYEHRRDGLHAIYQSSQDKPMCLRDASRFGAALSYARGAYVHILPITVGETYSEWCYAGQLCRVPEVKIVEAVAA